MARVGLLLARLVDVKTGSGDLDLFTTSRWGLELMLGTASGLDWDDRAALTASLDMSAAAI